MFYPVTIKNALWGEIQGCFQTLLSNLVPMLSNLGGLLSNLVPIGQALWLAQYPEHSENSKYSDNS
jgi:hypothetical protein